MAQEEILRPRFWHGQYLRARDFDAAVEYPRSAHRRHLLGPHTWGIVDGLDVVERPRLGSVTVTDCVLMPGVAVDGYGRSLVVLREAAIPTQLFATITVERWVPVWLEYLGAPAEPPAAGWEDCADPTSTARTQETWALVVGEQAPADEGLTVDGRLVPVAERPADGSLPMQALPDDDEDVRWLVPLGRLLWNGVDGFVPLTTPAQRDQMRQGRRSAGLVAGSLLAPDDELLLARRGPTGPMEVAAPQDPADPGQGARVAGSLGVDRDLGVRTPARTATPLTVRATGATEELLGLLHPGAGEGGWHVQLAPGGMRALTVREGAPGSSTVRLAVQEGGRVGVGTSDPDRNLTISSDGGTFLNVVDATHGQVLLGQGVHGAVLSAMTAHDLVLRAGGNISRLWVKADGRIGVGTATPDRALTVHDDGGSYANFIDTSSDAQVLVGADGSGGIVSSMSNHDLQLRAGGNSTKLIVKAGGNVGIGTTAPDRRLTLEGLGGTYLNARDLSAGVECLVGADSSGGILSTMSNHDLQLRAGGNSTKLIVKAGGNVGVGTTDPVSRLHVAADVSGDAASLASHVLTVENTSGSADADVLALRVGTGAPGPGNNYVSFFRGNTLSGCIEATAGGVAYETSGADFAEHLPIDDDDLPPLPGEVVAVREGRVTRHTGNAAHVSVVATGPGFVGNAPPSGERDRHACVVLLGQAPVRVRGAVRVGDLLVPSGDADGRAVAVAPGEVPFGSACLGQAWSASDGGRPDAQVLAAIGLAAVSTSASGARLARLEAAVRALGARA